MPCIAPFAAQPCESLPLRLRRSFVAGVRRRCAQQQGHVRLLARSRGRFFADIDLSQLLAQQDPPPKEARAPSQTVCSCKSIQHRHGSDGRADASLQALGLLSNT